MDECVADAHNCSSDAFCNNTHGSFNYTCKPGFTGDGENCTGSIFSGLSVLVWQQKLYYFSFILSLCYNLLLIAMQRQRWIQGRWIWRLATSLFLAVFVRTVQLALYSHVMRDFVYSQRENTLRL